MKCVFSSLFAVILLGFQLNASPYKALVTHQGEDSKTKLTFSFEFEEQREEFLMTYPSFEAQFRESESRNSIPYTYHLQNNHFRKNLEAVEISSQQDLRTINNIEAIAEGDFIQFANPNLNPQQIDNLLKNPTFFYEFKDFRKAKEIWSALAGRALQEDCQNMPQCWDKLTHLREEMSTKNYLRDSFIDIITQDKNAQDILADLQANSSLQPIFSIKEVQETLEWILTADSRVNPYTINTMNQGFAFRGLTPRYGTAFLTPAAEGHTISDELLTLFQDGLSPKYGRLEDGLDAAHADDNVNRQLAGDMMGITGSYGNSCTKLSGVAFDYCSRMQEGGAVFLIDLRDENRGQAVYKKSPGLGQINTEGKISGSRIVGIWSANDRHTFYPNPLWQFNNPSPILPRIPLPQPGQSSEVKAIDS